MMRRIKHKWHILKAVALVTYKEWSAYRTHSMVSIFVGPVYFIVQYFIWTALYGENGSLNGIELEQMIRYFGAAALIGYLTMDFADWNLSMLIRTGKFLTFAMRPIHHPFFALSQKLGHRLLGFLFEFVPCFIIFSLLFKINMIPAHLGWTALSVLLAFFMNFFVNYCIGMFSFWIVESAGIRNVYYLVSGLFSGGLIPLVFLPNVFQRIQFFLPFQYTVYVPAMVYTGNYTLGGISFSIPEIVGIQAMVLIVMFLLSELMYKVAMKHFTDVGA